MQSLILGTSLLASSSLYAQTPEHITPLPPQPKGINQPYQGGHTIGHYALDAEQAMGATKQDYVTLENLITQATERIRKRNLTIEKNGRAILEHIGITLMLNDYQSATNNQGNIDLFHEMLRTKQMDCDTSALFYMSVADHAQLPLHAVVNHPAYKQKTNEWKPVHGHVFLRWRISDTQYFNWEGGSNKELPNSWYAEHLGEPRPLTDNEHKMGLWQEARFQEMSPDRFLWWVFDTRAEFGDKKLRKTWEEVQPELMKQALTWSNRKAQENQNNPEYFLIRGDIHRARYDFNDALTQYEHALSLAPPLPLTRELMHRRNHCWIILEQQINQTVAK